MKINKITLTSYILNIVSLLLPILSLMLFIVYVSMLPGTASDKEGWGFGIAFLMIPIVITSGVCFLISAVMTVYSKNKYLYILSSIVISYYTIIAIFLKIAAPDFYFLVSNFLFIFYGYCFFVFCKRDKKLTQIEQFY